MVGAQLLLIKSVCTLRRVVYTRTKERYMCSGVWAELVEALIYFTGIKIPPRIQLHY